MLVGKTDATLYFYKHRINYETNISNNIILLNLISIKLGKIKFDSKNILYVYVVISTHSDGFGPVTV